MGVSGMAEGHNPRCAIFNDPPSLRSPRDCDCGFIPPLDNEVAELEAALVRERERVEGQKRSADELGQRLRRATENAESAEERVRELERQNANIIRGTFAERNDLERQRDELAKRIKELEGSVDAFIGVAQRFINAYIEEAAEREEWLVEDDLQDEFEAALTAVARAVLGRTHNPASEGPDPYELRSKVGVWLRLKAKHEGRYDSGILHRLAADADHSALLHRLFSGKEPLPEPPPLHMSYPDYEKAEQEKGMG